MLRPRLDNKDGAVPYTECRAKTCANGAPGTSVFDHCRYTGAIALALYALLPAHVANLLPEHSALLAALHDLGKVSPDFQGKYFFAILTQFTPDWAKIYRDMGANSNHAEIGAEAMRIYLDLQDKAPLVQAIAAHHGYRCQNIGQLKDQKTWQPEREKLIAALEKEFGHQLTKQDAESGRTDLLTGLTCVADWIASDEKFFPPHGAPLNAEKLATQVQTILADCGFRNLPLRADLSFHDIFDFNPRAEQLALIDAVKGPGIYILEASMGSGKTEAALYAAYNLMAKKINNGLYFALPTRLTSDKIHERVETFIDRISERKQAVKLAHGQAWLKEFEYGSQDEGKIRTPAWFSPAKRGLLYPLSVGTIDQALLSVMNVKHNFVRLLGLAGKVVILDEVHSYDLYTGTLLDALAKTLRDVGCTVIILSATLTRSRREKLLGANSDSLNAYPLVSSVPSDAKTTITTKPRSSKPNMTVNLQWLYGDAITVVDNALNMARQGCNVVCIANTVKQAQLWYRMLLSEIDEYDRTRLKYGLLHSRFPLFRRESIENDWINALGKKQEKNKRPAGSILIATQIVEQSVDIDADYMISELAPADMLLQRMGRLWRHERPNRPCQAPVMTVAMEKNPALCENLDDEQLQPCVGSGSWHVYAPFVLLRTYEILSKRHNLTIPMEIRTILESVYDDSQIPSDSDLHLKLYGKMKDRQQLLQAQAVAAGVHVTSLPVRSDDDENPPTRYNSLATVTLLIVREIDTAADRDTISMTLLNRQKVMISRYDKNIDVTRALYQNLVSVPMSRDFSGLARDTAILQQHFHAAEMPCLCQLDEDGIGLLLHSNGIPIEYAYHPDFGVYARQQTPSPTPKIPSITPKNDPLPTEDNFAFKEGEDW